MSLKRLIVRSPISFRGKGFPLRSDVDAIVTHSHMRWVANIALILNSCMREKPVWLS